MRLRPIIAALLALSATVAPASQVAAANLPRGHFTWTGSAAAAFALPADVQLVSSWHDPGFNLDYVRYQQYAAPLRTYVDGSQLTVVSRAGRQLIVAGAYYPGARSLSAPTLSVAKALAVAADERGGLSELPQDIKGLATRRATLRLDPESGRHFYLVATGAPGANRYQEIDAETGALLEAWSGVDQISPGHGVGVKGDTKTLTPGTFGTVGDLTKQVSGLYRMQSWDDRFLTFNANNGSSYPSNPVADANNDNAWEAASQAAAVDAQYYAALTIQFYRQTFGWDWFAQCTALYGNAVRSVVHFGTSYDNAFWDEIRHYVVYGDGSGSFNTRAYSAGQDVVSHELTHGVTQCRAPLDYKKESGALNEAFSDIMATSAEWTMEEPLSSNCRLAPGQTECADWLIAEDLARTASGVVIRDLADPGAVDQPSHYADRLYPGPCNPSSYSNDYCGVHANSTIASHAFYLLAHGGRNSRCSGPTDPHADCQVVVPATNLDHAEHIFFGGYGMLSPSATMCDARNATVAQAHVLYAGSVTDLAAVLLAWQAVGLGQVQCDPSADFSISLADPTLELAPGGSSQLQLALVRGAEQGQIDFVVDEAAPATAVPDAGANLASGGSLITFTADSDAHDGAYPILVTANTLGGDPHYAAAALVIDAESPTAAVTNVGFVPMTTVTTNGTIPVRVAWSASDGASGVASAELDHSPDGSGWSPIYGPGAPVSPTEYNTTAGPHQFQVLATDGVGNSATSAALVSPLSAFQETAPVIYKGGWKTFSSATAWGQTRFSKNRGASAKLIFNGTDVAWIAQRGPRRGVARVLVDGVKTHVDLYATSLSERRVVFVAANLAAGQHTIKIVVRHTRGRPRVDVDGFFVLS